METGGMYEGGGEMMGGFEVHCKSDANKGGKIGEMDMKDDSVE